MFCDELCQQIIRLARDLSCALRFRYALDRGIVQREDHQLDSVFVHFRQTELPQIEQAAFDIRPRGKPTGIPGIVSLADGVGDRKMFFERDLTLHESPLWLGSRGNLTRHARMLSRA